MTKKEKILNQAQKFIQKGSLDKAILEYKAVCEFDPADIPTRLRLGDLYVKVGNKDDAISEYTEGAKVYTQKGFYLKAIAVYKQILKLDESNIEVHNKLADLYTKQRLIVDAISEYSYIANVFEKKGKTADVFELFKKMSGLDPENLGVKLKLADMHLKLGYEKDALDEYGWIFDKLINQGKADKAEKVYFELHKVRPRESRILEGLALLNKKKGDKAEFLRYSRRLFDIYKDVEDLEKCELVSNSILELEPTDKVAREFISSRKGKKEPLIEFPSFEVKDIVETEKIIEAEHIEELVVEPPKEEGIEITVEPFVEEEHKAEAKEEEFFEVSVEEEKIPVKPGKARPDLPIEEITHVEPQIIEPTILEHTEEVPHVEPIGAVEAIEEAPLEVIGEEIESPVETPSEVVPPIELPGMDELSQVLFEEGVMGRETRPSPRAGAPDTHLPENSLEGWEGVIWRGNHAESGSGGGGYVDLSKEFGIEEALENLVGSWSEQNGKDTFEEFKAGVGDMLKREDVETHYNLGIAYMEMGLFEDASREFKLSLKDPQFEFDAYTRLGHCSLELSQIDESVSYYFKALKMKGRNDEDRKGIMYELGLAYETSGRMSEAVDMFKSVYAIDPQYREVFDKVEELSVIGSMIPRDDNMIEVEFL